MSSVQQKSKKKRNLPSLPSKKPEQRELVPRQRIDVERLNKLPSSILQQLRNVENDPNFLAVKVG